MIERAQSEAMELLESENWKKEAGVDDIEGIVYTKTTKTYGKVFKLVVRYKYSTSCTLKHNNLHIHVLITSNLSQVQKMKVW